jgi:thiaminase/transcriptional activator TenA
MSFSEELREENRRLWDAILCHPFIEELGKGSLPIEKFTYYIKQDFLYLEEFTRCIGLAASKAESIDSMQIWAEMMAGCLKYETEMLEKLSTKLNISAEVIPKTELSPTNRAYTNHLLKIAHSGTIGENVAALLPCMWTYKDIGEIISKFNGVQAHPIYSEWCLAYSKPEYLNLVQTYLAFIDKYALDASIRQKNKMRSHFSLSLRYEYMFWDMAYGMELWPIPKFE